MVRCFVLCVGLACASPVLAAPPVGLLPLLRSFRDRAPTVLIEAARARYRSAPFGERLIIRLSLPEGVQTQEVVIRADPAASRLRVEVGELIIAASSDGSSGILRIVHRADPDSLFERSFEGPLTLEFLEKILPPMPIPSLALAFGAADAPILPTGGKITWFGPRADRTVLTLLGVSTSGGASLPISLMLDHQGRITHVQAAWPGAGGVDADLSIDIETFDPGDPQSWAIAPEGRTLIDSLSAYRPRESRLKIDDPVNLDAYLDLASQPWQANELVVPEGRPFESRYAAVALYRPTTDLAVPRAALAAAQAALVQLEHRRAEAQAAGRILPPVRVATRPVVVFDLVAFTHEALRHQAVQWADEQGRTALLWSTSPQTTIDRLVPAGTCAMILLDAQHRILRIDDLSAGVPESLAGEIAALLAGHAWPDQ